MRVEREQGRGIQNSDNAPWILIAKREVSTIVSTWNEYLALRSKGPLQAEIAVCNYESLGEREYDEEGELKDLPFEIGSKPVIGVEDGIIVGGNLECWDERHAVLTISDAGSFNSFAKENGFSLSPDELSILHNALGSLSRKP